LKLILVAASLQQGPAAVLLLLLLLLLLLPRLLPRRRGPTFPDTGSTVAVMSATLTGLVPLMRSIDICSRT